MSFAVLDTVADKTLDGWPITVGITVTEVGYQGSHRFELPSGRFELIEQVDIQRAADYDGEYQH